MIVLVTGVGGFIGSRVARRVVAEGHEVIGVDDFSSGHRENVPAEVGLVAGDLAEPAISAALPARCDLILHLAGQSSGEISFDDPVTDLQKNTVSTLNLIRYGLKAGARRIVYASSMSVYGSVADAPVAETEPPRPLSCYGVGKLAAEGYLRIYGADLPWIALRMFNVYGPGQDLRNLRQGMVSIYVAQALATGRVQVKGGLSRFRDFIYIDDVVDAWYRAGTLDAPANCPINVGTGTRTTVEELLAAISAHVPGMSRYIEGSTPGDQSGIYADTTRLKSLLGIASFTSLKTGLAEFVSWAIEPSRPIRR